ncbi:DUF2922 domain-containing protein [Clostridium sp.]|uniref:DUF2922 domain-containing protein n=1 Tax=Clostridium sp. TaxID=1506 RepID=UPI0029103D0A|nr:DUF2922 domain-containing protein [Clostridium sp.]MDU3353714.1 DUF2922 domain-containing protein [Clostridium sp.]
MEFTLSMTFTTSNGDKSTISIEGVKENLTQAEEEWYINWQVFSSVSTKTSYQV